MIPHIPIRTHPPPSYPPPPDHHHRHRYRRRRHYYFSHRQPSIYFTPLLYATCAKSLVGGSVFLIKLFTRPSLGDRLFAGHLHTELQQGRQEK